MRESSTDTRHAKRTLLHLRLGTSVPCDCRRTSVRCIGESGTFKAEHSDAEPRLVFLKPTTAIAPKPFANHD